MQPNSPIPTVYIRQVFLVLIIFLISFVIFWNLKSFLPAFLGAYTLYVLLRKWMIKLTAKLKGHDNIAAFLLMIFSFLVILLPINGLINILSNRIIPTLKHSNELMTSAEQAIQKIESQFGISILTPENLRNLSAWGVNSMQNIVGATFNGLFIVVLMYFVLYFMLTDGSTMEKSFYKWIPLRDHSISFIKKHLNALVISNAIGIPVVAFLQGIVALVGYWITGVPSPFIWFVATCVAAVIPVLGAALIYVPLAILLITNGMTTQGIILFLYGFLIVGTVDNLFRFWLQKKIGDTHPLITIFGVIIGVNLFGFIGLIFGPILISLCVLLIQIYRYEYGTPDPHNGIPPD